MLERAIGDVLEEQKLGVSGYEHVDEFNEDMHWLRYCLDLPGLMFDQYNRNSDWYEMGRRIHIHYNQFLIHDEKSLMFDSGCITKSDELVELVDDVLDGDDLDYMVISHPDVDHTGNVRRFIERYPDMEILAPNYGAGHDIYYLADSIKMGEGDTMDLGTHTVSFHDAPFGDSAVTAYMMEQTTNTFYPVDFLTMPHLDYECNMYGEDYEEGTATERMIEFAKIQFFWFQWADLDKVKQEIQRMLDEYDPETIACSHGPVFRGDSATELLQAWHDRIIDEVAESAAQDTQHQNRIQSA